MVMAAEKLTSDQAAELLGISRPAFYRFAKAHNINPTNPKNKNQQRTKTYQWNYDDIKPYILKEDSGSKGQE